MALYADRVKDSTSITGTGAITLSGTAPTGFQSFATAFGATPQTVAYCIADQTGNNWEVGTGVFNGTTGLTRVTVLGSSNGGSLVNFTGGTQDVFCTAPAAYLLPAGANTQIQFNNAGAFGGSANFTYDTGTNTFTVGPAGATTNIETLAPTGSTIAGSLRIRGKNASATNGAGGGISYVGGNALGTGTGGGHTFSCGSGRIGGAISFTSANGTLNGGSMSFNSGQSDAGGTGGNFNMNAGIGATTASGGFFEMTAGNAASSGNGGSFTMTAGGSLGSGAGGDFTFTALSGGAANGNMYFNTDYGTVIQLTASLLGDQQLGFYGVTPVAQPTAVPVTAAGIHAALVSLGLIT